MLLLVHHFSTLYCTFTDENWSALLELIWLISSDSSSLEAAAVLNHLFRRFWFVFFSGRGGEWEERRVC